MKVSIDNLQIAVEDILREYGDVVYKATDDGLKEAEKVLVNNLKVASPVGKTGEYAKSWRGKKGKGKKSLRRYVGNTKMVPGKNGEVPLSNILEYSPIRGKPFIKRTYEQSIPAMADAIVGKIKSEG